MIFVDAGIEVELNIDYEPTLEKIYSSEWFQSSNLSWHTYDLGDTTDKRSVTLSTNGNKDDILELESFLIDYSSGDTNNLEITVSDGEDIFGVEIDYSTNIFAYLARPPITTYQSLDWYKIEFTLLLDTAQEVTLKSMPTGYSWELMPWNMAVVRENFLSSTMALPYSGNVFVGYDESKSKTLKASFNLELEEAIWFKLTLLNLRTGKQTIVNPYFDAFGDDRENITLKVKDFKESRTNVNLYSIELEMLLSE